MIFSAVVELKPLPGSDWMPDWAVGGFTIVVGRFPDLESFKDGVLGVFEFIALVENIKNIEVYSQSRDIKDLNVKELYSQIESGDGFICFGDLHTYPRVEIN